MEDLTFNVPFTKVDKKRRVVVGIATADNLDPEGDLIKAEASAEAFSNWIGNIREMHAPKAVGKAVNYRPVKVPYQGRDYDGIQVEAYISKGAEDTWQKVLDGTLTSFSVGGKITDYDNKFDKSTNRSIRVVKKYDLNELSLVDNPGNPAAQINLVKMATDGSLHYDLMQKYTVFYCPSHGLSKFDDAACEFGDIMDEIGQVDEKDYDVVTKLIETKFKKGENVSDLQKNKEDGTVESVTDESESGQGRIAKFFGWLGGTEDSPFESEPELIKSAPAPVNITINGTTPVVEKKAAEEVADDDTEDTDKNIEKSEGASEENGGNVEEFNMEKLMEGLGAMLDEKLTKVKEEVAESVDEKIAEVAKSVDGKLEEVDGRVEKVESSGAMKKSVDDESSDEDDDDLEKSVGSEPFWGGILVPQEVCKVLGYKS